MKTQFMKFFQSTTPIVLLIGSLIFIFLNSSEAVSNKIEFTTNHSSFSKTASSTIKLNIFAVLSSEIENAVKAASKDLLIQEGLTTLPQLGYQIHCTLYMTNYPPEIYGKLLNRIKKFCSTTRSFTVKTSGLHITKDNWLFINLEKNRNLQKLSDAIVELASPLRAPTTFIPELAKDNPEKVEMIQKYGSPNVFSQFEPHLTLLAKADATKLLRFVAKNSKNPLYGLPITGYITAIGIGEADKFGQIASAAIILPLLPPHEKIQK